MNDTISRAETFLSTYRMLEGALEKRYGRSRTGSVVMEYLQEADSEPYRYDLNVCREIRNLLSHNADDGGAPLVEPSEAVLETLREILDYVVRPRRAADCGTPKDKILCAHANDSLDMMHRMRKLGFSNVPVMEHGEIIGVFSPGALFAYLEQEGLDGIRDGMRIGDLGDALDFERHGAERYLFMKEDATLTEVRDAFERRTERNHRLRAVFITPTGRRGEPLLSMLTPWDVLQDDVESDGRKEK